MVLLKCYKCAVEFDFPHHVPANEDHTINCINCENSPLRLEMWSRATRDQAQKREILKRLAALKSKLKS